MRLMIAAMLLTLGAGAFAADAAPGWNGERRDLDANSHRGSATISADRESVTLGTTFSVDVRFVNGAAGDEFYNPFFGRTPLPARLAIFNDEHKYLGDLLAREEEVPRRTLDAQDWTFIPSLCYVGHVEKIMAGYVPSTPEGLSRTLPPGEYYLQMIYFKSFLAQNPAELERRPLDDAEKVFLRFQKEFDREELFRSNVVKVRFTAN